MIIYIRYMHAFAQLDLQPSKNDYQTTKIQMANEESLNSAVSALIDAVCKTNECIRQQPTYPTLL